MRGRQRLIPLGLLPTTIRGFTSVPDVDAAYGRLRARGVAVKEPKVAPYGMKQLYVSDPDGYGLCFQRPAA